MKAYAAFNGWVPALQADGTVWREVETVHSYNRPGLGVEVSVVGPDHDKHRIVDHTRIVVSATRPDHTVNPYSFGR